MSDPIEKVHEQLAEIAAFCFCLAGNDSALAILNLTRPERFGSFEGAMAEIMSAVEEIKAGGGLITFLGVKEQLEQKGLLKKVGGVKGLDKLTREYPVRDGEVMFKVDGDSIIADAETVARVVNERYWRRRLLRKMEFVSRRLQDPDSPGGPMMADEARTELALEISASDDITEYPTKSDAEEFDVTIDLLMRLTNEQAVGLLTPFDGFNQLTGGIQPKDFLKISAVDKMGKSTLSLSLANYVARVLKQPVLYVSPEMDRFLLRRRRIAMNSDGRLPIKKLVNQHFKLSQTDIQTMLEVWDTIHRDPFYTLDRIRSGPECLLEAERVVRAKGVVLIVWDYLQKFEGQKNQNQEQAISEMSKGIDWLAQKFTTRGHPLANIVVDQLNDDGLRHQRVFGVPRSEHSYGSKQANKDATLKTTLALEPELFSCQCPDQTVVRKVFDVKRKVEESVPVPRWEFRPANSVCPDCKRAGRDPFVRSLNPEREGKWFIEGARNSEAGVVIQLKFDGRFMTMEEATEEISYQPAPVLPATDPTVKSIFDDFDDNII